MLGTERLKKLGQVLYGSRDPAKRFFEEAPYRFRKVDGNYHLHLRLPFVSSGDVNLHKKSDEVIIRLAAFKRHVSLRQRMSSCEPLSARIKDGELVVVLGRNNAQSEAKKETSRPA